MKLVFPLTSLGREIGSRIMNEYVGYKAIEQGVLDALTHWSDDGRVEHSLKFLHLTRKQSLAAPVTTRDLIKKYWLELNRQEEEIARAIKLRFWQGEVLQAVAQSLNVSIATAKRKCDQGVARLSEMIKRAEDICREKLVQTSLAYLPPPSYAELYGQSETIDLLEEQLLSNEAPWIITILGLGGSGKSAVADAVIRRLLPAFRFERVIWLRSDQPAGNGSIKPSAIVERLAGRLAQQINQYENGSLDSLTSIQQSQAIWHRLKHEPHLIVIDNLESESETLILMELLNSLANPSKFLVTSRSFQISLAGVYHVSLSDLSQQAANDLLLEQLKINGPQGQEVTPQQREGLIAPIYETVGGHPLAIKLIARMLDTLPLTAILKDFKQGHSLSRDDIYGPIFERAWQIMSPEARLVLEKVGEYGDEAVDADTLYPQLGLNEDQIWRAIRELTYRSLIEPRGTLMNKRYGSHRLTQRFLNTKLNHPIS